MRAFFDHVDHRIHVPADLPTVGAPEADTACGASLQHDDRRNWCLTAYPPNAMDSIWGGKTHERHEDMTICAECAPLLAPLGVAR